MRTRFFTLVAVLALCGCGEHAPNAFPDSARVRFEASCPPSSAVCRCTWDKITRTMTADEYAEAVHRFREEGLMEPRITHARTVCVEHNHET